MATATEPTIEQRLAALETAVDAIRQQLALLVVSHWTTGPAPSSRQSPTAPSGLQAAQGGRATDETAHARPIKRAKLDDQGRLIPLTPEEAQAEAESIREMLDELRSIPDDPDEDDAEFFRAIDSHRPHRPLFEGFY